MHYTAVEINRGKILERWIDENGEDHTRRTNFSPTFYYPNENGDHKDIFGNIVKEKVFDNIVASKEWRSRMKDTNLSVLGMDDYALQYISDTYQDEIKFDKSNMRIAAFDIEVKSPDGFPKPELAEHPIDSITHYDSIEDTFFVFALYPWDEYLSKKRGHISDDVIDRTKFVQYDSEIKLLEAYKTFFCAKPPHVLSGWHSEGFDIPYVVNRLDKLFGDGTAKQLSPWGMIYEKTTRDNFGNEITVYNIGGIACLDYIALYRKFILKPRKNYKLDYIAQVELGEGKVSYQGKLHELSETDPQKYVDYNIRDVDIIIRLDKKLKLFQLAFELAYYAKCSFQDTLGTIKIWDAIIFNHLKKENIAVPEQKRFDKEHFDGAFVKEPIVGLYEWLLSFDLTSLYPHIMMQWNISPETYVGRDEPQDIELFANKLAEFDHRGYAYNPSGCMYRKDIKGVIPIVVEKVFLHRKAHKKSEFDAYNKAEECKQRGDHDGYTKFKNIESSEYVAQWSRKILINGLYGATGNRYFRYYRIENALSTTAGAQLAIRWIERKLNEYFNKAVGTTNVNYVVYIDTDSVYIKCYDLLEKLLGKKGKKVSEIEPIKIVDLLDRIGKEKLEPFIADAYQEMADYTNSYEQKMVMDREAIASRGFWTAKKRYALMIWDNEGKRKYDENGNVKPVMKITGLETQKAGTPELVVPALKKSYEIILTGDDNQELVDHYTEFRKEYFKNDYSQLSQISGVNNIAKYSGRDGYPIKGAPHNVKAALFFNRLAKEHGIPPIKDGEKIAMMYLKSPNPYGENKIGWVSGEELPKEFALDMELMGDKRMMFSKTFEEPMKTLCDVTGWSYEAQSDSLGDMWGI